MRENWAVTVFGLVLALLGPILVADASEKFIHRSYRLGWLLLAQAGLVAVVAAILSLVFFWERSPASSIGLRALTLQTLASGLALAAFFRYVFSPMAYRALRRSRLGGFAKGLSELQGLPVWYLVLAVIIGGVAEEILYRGYAIERIADLTGSLWLAVTVPVAVFAIAHVPTWGRGVALTTLVSGGIFAAFYLWQRDLTACIVAHVVTDFAGIVVGLARVDRRAMKSLSNE
ncbi:MAG: type II CAAX endopeptidase family protein [Methylococcus sp.]|nr:type II CAAX endopeptidase family protein [Methylococcus sp.]